MTVTGVADGWGCAVRSACRTCRHLGVYAACKACTACMAPCCTGPVAGPVHMLIRHCSTPGGPKVLWWAGGDFSVVCGVSICSLHCLLVPTLSAASTEHQLASQLKTSRWPVGTLAVPCTSSVKPRCTAALQKPNCTAATYTVSMCCRTNPVPNMPCTQRGSLAWPGMG